MVKGSHKNRVKNTPNFYKNRQLSSLSKPSKILVEIGLFPAKSSSDFKDNDDKKRMGSIYEVSKYFIRLRERGLIKPIQPNLSKYIITESGIDELILNDMLQPDEFWLMCCKYFDRNSEYYIKTDSEKILVKYIHTHYSISLDMVNLFYLQSTRNMFNDILLRNDFFRIIQLLDTFMNTTFQRQDKLISKLIINEEEKKFWEELIRELIRVGILLNDFEKKGKLKITHLGLLVLFSKMYSDYQTDLKSGLDKKKLDRILVTKFNIIIKKYETFLPKIFLNIDKVKKLINNDCAKIILFIIYPMVNGKLPLTYALDKTIFKIHDNMQSDFKHTLTEFLESGTKIISKYLQDMKYSMSLSNNSDIIKFEHLLNSEDKQNRIGIRRLERKPILKIPRIEELRKFTEPLSYYFKIKHMLTQTPYLTIDYLVLPNFQKQLFEDFERLISFNFFIRLNQTFEKHQIKNIMKDNDWYYDNIQSLIKYEQTKLSILKLYSK